MPIIFSGGFFTELRGATREIHFLHDRIEGESIAVEQLLDLAPAPEAAERIDVLQEQVAGLERFLERDGVEFALEFAFAIQPRGQGRQVVWPRVLPARDSIGDERVTLLGVFVDFQIDREQFLRCAGEGVFLERVTQFRRRHRKGLGNFLRAERGLGEHRERVQSGGVIFRRDLF